MLKLFRKIEARMIGQYFVRQDRARRSEIATRCLLLVMILGHNVCRADEPQWESLSSGIDPKEQAVAGEWRKSGSDIMVAAHQGARLILPIVPVEEYDLRTTFTRQTGADSVGMVFVHNGRQVVFEVDAWGEHLAGFQNVDGQPIRENSTRHENVALSNGRKYTIAVEVRKDTIRGLLNGKEVCRHETDGSDLSMHELWRLPEANQFGLVTWNGDTVFHTVELRKISSKTVTPLQSKSLKVALEMKPERPPTGSPVAASRKRVVIVIANEDFFYREYHDPREELERAGIEVTVAAGQKASCRPHGGSGQGSDGGGVEADMALKDVAAKDFDAILFSGGWGASSYQFAFQGRYQNASYNGNRSIKTEANRVINEFVQQDKYVCALCNGVSVLAWARVNGNSPLAGKRVCAPVREAPAGIYDGRQAQPSCRWHPQMNGAILSPSGVIGQRGNVADDVLVDGRIITGEDDPSAREMGRTIARVLLQP